MTDPVPEPWAKTGDSILKHYGVKKQAGLSAEEVEKRLQQYGPNG